VDIFDRLGNLIRSILDEEEPSRAEPGRFSDPDESAAWEELEAYMKDQTAGATGERTGPGAENRFGTRAPGAVPESLKKDFRNLEVAPGAPMPEVRKAYKRLMAAFHPDRHSADAEKLRTATEITKKLNQSFQRIRDYYEGESSSTQPT
jgi:DnaJ-domain-containing protein 1